MRCPSCGKDMVRRDGRFGPFLSCLGYPECDTSVSLHKRTGEVIGTPADQELRDLRKRAHRIFDQLWDGPRALMTRATAYSNARNWLMLSKDECHIGMFDKTYCMALINICKRWGLKEPQ